MRSVLFLLALCSVATAQVTVQGGMQLTPNSTPFTWPSTAGSNGYTLTTNGSGVLGWTSPQPYRVFSVSSTFESSARVNNESSGSAGPTFGSYGMEIATGTSTSGKVWTDYNPGYWSGSNVFYADSNIRISCYLERVTQGSDYDLLVGLHSGTSLIISAASIDYTQKHVGIKCNRTGSGTETWSGTCGDGTAESTVSLTVTTPTNMNLFTIIYNPSSVSFYVNETLAGTITTHIPSVANLEASGSVFSTFLTNRAVASSTTFGVGAFEFATDAGGISGGASSLANPMTTTGDIIYSADNLGSPVRLGIGSAGQYLTISGGIPAWSSATLPSSAGTSGNVVTSNGTNWISSADHGEWTEVSVTGSNFTTTNTTATNITGLTFNGAASTTYELEGTIYTSSSSSAGVKLAISSTGTSPSVYAMFTGMTSATTAASVAVTGSATLEGTAFDAVAADGLVKFWAIVKSGTGSPVITVQLAKVTSGTATAYIGSTMRYKVLGN